MPQNPALALGPVARALIAGTVTAVTLPSMRGGAMPPRRPRGPRFVTVTLSTDGGELAVRVLAGHKIYARVASRARRGDFWVVGADLVMGRGGMEIRARHLLSSRDNFLPQAGKEAENRQVTAAAGVGQAAFAGW